MSSGDALIQDFVAGRYRAIETGLPVQCPIRAIVTAPSLAGREAELLRGIGLAKNGSGGTIGVVSDENTRDVLGDRVERALPGCRSVVLDHPHADEATAADLRERTRHCDALVAVGSGTLNDLCKHVTHGDGRPCAVFATAASMNGYVTGTASITRGDFKHSLPSHAPRGVFLDLQVLAAAPPRLTRAGLGDALCRGTAQIDWLLSHLLLDTVYAESPFAMQRVDEPKLLAAAPRLLDGDLAAMATLVHVLTLGGLGVVVTGTSHSGSMGEHGISHYIDMFARPHPGSLHGAQVGVATLTMARLQAQLLAEEAPPVLRASRIDDAALAERYGAQAAACRKALEAKALTGERLAAANARLAESWADWRHRLAALAIPVDRLEAALLSIDAARTGADLGLEPAAYRAAVAHAHEIRDRFGFLDLAAHAGRLEAFAAGEG
ncbi:MAG: iron-containing alcohol dehydrogenase [Geminicoccaceae bacterium]